MRKELHAVFIYTLIFFDPSAQTVLPLTQMPYETVGHHLTRRKESHLRVVVPLLLAKFQDLPSRSFFRQKKELPVPP